MEMEFVGLVKVFLRWLWLIILIVATTCALLYFNPNLSLASYRADVTLLFTSPDREDVQAFDDYVFTSERDEVAININKFVEIAQYEEVRARTLAELNIDEDYDLGVTTEIGADFVYISVTAGNPELAARIANAHANHAIQYFGELRVLSANQALEYFDDAIIDAAEELRLAELAFSNFQTQHQVVDLESELMLQYTILEQLEISRAQVLVSQATGGQTRSMTTSNGSVAPVTTVVVDMATIDSLIAAQRQVLANLSAIESEYTRLEQDVEAARSHYDYLTDQNTNIETRQSFSSEAMFIQILQAAEMPTAPEDNTLRNLALGAAGSFGFAVLLVFFLDYLIRKW